MLQLSCCPREWGVLLTLVARTAIGVQNILAAGLSTNFSPLVLICCGRQNGLYLVSTLRTFTEVVPMAHCNLALHSQTCQLITPSRTFWNMVYDITCRRKNHTPYAPGGRKLWLALQSVGKSMLSSWSYIDPSNQAWKAQSHKKIFLEFLLLHSRDSSIRLIVYVVSQVPKWIGAQNQSLF